LTPHRFRVNGSEQPGPNEFRNVALYLLRTISALPLNVRTPNGCFGLGECGACTVLVNGICGA